MIETREIEFVGIEDVCEIVRLTQKAQDKGHYVRITLSNYGWDVSVNAKIGGFDANEKDDYGVSFDLSDEPNDVKKMNETKAYLKGLIEDETV